MEMGWFLRRMPGKKYNDKARSLFLALLRSNTGLTPDDEEDALANIGGMIANSFKFVRNPQEVGGPLQDVGVILESRDGSSACKHGHKVMAHLVIAHVDDVILFPAGACGIRIAICKRLHGPLQDLPRLLAQFEDTLQDRRFRDLSVLTRGIEFDRIGYASLNLHLGRVCAHGAQGSQPQEYLGNSLCSIAHALKIAGN